MTVFLCFESSVSLVVLAVYEPYADALTLHVDTASRRSLAARCLAWLVSGVVRFERCAEG